METLERYRQLVRDLIHRYAQYKSSVGQVEREVVIDPVTDHYELMMSGWNGKYRVHGSVIHIDIRNGKIWIQHDGTNRAIAEELVEAGVPREDIVLAFHHPDTRQYTDFAVA